MEHAFSEISACPGASTDLRSVITRPGYQAFQIMRAGFAISLMAAGLDKYFNSMVVWDEYLPTFVDHLVIGNGHGLMYLVGSIEIGVGVGVLIKPKVFAYVIAAWLFLTTANLLIIPGYDDAALRDFGLMVGALALGRLASEYSR